MDRRVKERLIGASILVALVVLVVPELLSGPKPLGQPTAILPAAAPEPIRNVTVDLTTSKAPANAEPEATESQPASSAAGPAPAPTDASPPPSPEASAVPRVDSARPAPVESAAPSPTSTAHGSWSVQLGSFASRANAENLTRQLKGQGFSVFVLSGGSGAAVRYRVRVGPLSDRESAERTAAKLKSLGHVSSLVAPTA
jgi:DedD protein